jgi:hypothetical protein
MVDIAPGLHEKIHQLIADGSDDLKHGAAYCIGHLAVSNVQFFLPLMVDGIHAHILTDLAIKAKTQEYYYIVAINEMISQLTKDPPKLDIISLELWNLLMESASDSELEEGTKSLIADCLGKLLLTNPAVFIPLIEEKRATPNTALRGRLDLFDV